MATTNLPEVWMRGPVEAVPALLQPVAHALLQAREEVNELASNITPGMLWQRPAGVASIAFHLQHMKGVIDRLFTYAQGKSLSTEQLAYLQQEGKEPAEPVTIDELVKVLNSQVDTAMAALKTMDETTLPAYRGVGRKQLPSTVLGLLFHAAEHTMRHLGQLLVTVKVLRDNVGRSGLE
ncbi:MAG: DinB family protein [Segetibacter sp.]|nr:DinB family protein [Segetibacter sp.]